MNSTSISYAKMVFFSNFLLSGLLNIDNSIGPFGTKVDVQFEALLSKNAEKLQFLKNDLLK